MATNFLHIILLLSVLLSTTGLRVSEHFCQKEKQASSIFQLKSCCAKDAPCQNICEQEDGKNCCETHAEYFQSDQDKQVQNFEFKQLKQPEIIAALLVVFDIKLPVLENAPAKFSTYRPPIVRRDILTLFQTFLC
jgi:hypothetical protein